MNLIYEVQEEKTILTARKENEREELKIKKKRRDRDKGNTQ